MHGSKEILKRNASTSCVGRIVYFVRVSSTALFLFVCLSHCLVSEKHLRLAKITCREIVCPRGMPNQPLQFIISHVFKRSGTQQLNFITNGQVILIFFFIPYDPEGSRSPFSVFPWTIYPLTITPPLGCRHCPEMKLLSGLARNTKHVATSLGCPGRPMGTPLNCSMADVSMVDGIKGVQTVCWSIDGLG